MMTYYIYKTQTGQLKISEAYCPHEFKIHAKTLAAAKTALTKYKKTLSKDLEITAETDDGLIMGVQHKEFNIHGVQFHPESIKTKLGIKILKNFINY